MVSPTTKHLRSQTVCLTGTLSVLLLSFNPKLLQGSMALEAACFLWPFHEDFLQPGMVVRRLGRRKGGSHCLTQFYCSNQPWLVLTREQNEKEKKIQSTVFLKPSYKTSQTTFLFKSVTLD